MRTRAARYHPKAFLLLVCAQAVLVKAQDYVTPGQYAYAVQSDIIYGADTNYLGLIDTLELDLYKPLGNVDARRPLLVLAHGGTWLAGCKHDPQGVVPTAIEFVQRGYVVASINYRLGWHKAEFVSGNVAGYGISPWPASSRALYPLDSAELKRAIFRGQQDMKAAIRFLRANAATYGYENPINSDKNSTDDHYNTALRFCIDHLETLAFCNASHNAESAALQVELMDKKSIPHGHPHTMFSQLYGMSDNVTFNLSAAGFRVSKYVPYGQVREVIPYLIRRAQENSSVTGDAGRELSLILQEVKRRGI